MSFPTAAHRQTHSKQAPHTWLYILAFVTVAACTYGLEKRIEMAEQRVIVDYN